MSNRPNRRARRLPEPPERDPWSDPRAAAWVAHIRHQVLPQLRGSAASITIAPDAEPDIKIAVELGLTLLLDKPLVVVVTPGRSCPEHLRRAADLIVDDADQAVAARRIRDFIDAQPEPER